MKNLRIRTALIAASIAAFGFAAVALAAPVTIGNDTLDAGGGDAVFDPANHNSDCGPGGDGPCYFTPTEDGEFGPQGDAFDGGLALLVGGRPFVDHDGQGDLKGRQLTVGPTKLGPLRVTRIERALPGSPTLRTLVRLKNTRPKPIRRDIAVVSDLGADEDTRVHRTSSRDRFLTPADRWAVVSDDPGGVGDPALVFAHHGKGRVQSKTAHASVVQGIDSHTAGWKARIGPNGTAYLLLYTEMWGSNGDAVEGARKYNRKRLSPPLRAGLSNGVQRNVLNWDLLG